MPTEARNWFVALLLLGLALPTFSDEPPKDHNKEDKENSEENAPKSESEKKFDDSLKKLMDDALAGKDRDNKQIDALYQAFDKMTESEKETTLEALEKQLKELSSEENLASETEQAKTMREFLTAWLAQQQGKPAPGTDGGPKTSLFDKKPGSSGPKTSLFDKRDPKALAEYMFRSRVRKRMIDAQVKDNKANDPNVATFKADLENVPAGFKDKTKEEKLDLAAKLLNDAFSRFGATNLELTKEAQAVSKPGESVSVDLEKILNKDQIRELKKALGVPQDKPISVEVGQFLAQAVNDGNNYGNILGVNTREKFDAIVKAREGTEFAPLVKKLGLDSKGRPTSEVVKGERTLDIVGAHVRSWEMGIGPQSGKFNVPQPGGKPIPNLAATEQFYVPPEGKSNMGIFHFAWDGTGRKPPNGEVPNEIAEGPGYINSLHSQRFQITGANCTSCHRPDSSEFFQTPIWHDLPKVNERLDLLSSNLGRYDKMRIVRQEINANVDYAERYWWQFNWNSRNVKAYELSELRNIRFTGQSLRARAP